MKPFPGDKEDFHDESIFRGRGSYPVKRNEPNHVLMVVTKILEKKYNRWKISNGMIVKDCVIPSKKPG